MKIYEEEEQGMQVQSFSGHSRYKADRLLGSGTASQVYLVSDRADGRFYAMKVCEDKELLRQESDLLKTLKHRAFPAWKDYFEEDVGYLVMEYIEGVTLQEWLRTREKIPLALAEGIVVRILEALKYLHHQRLIYRDIKPANIILSKDGRVRVLDVGGAVEGKYKVGTYGYAAPEQFWEGIRLGPECDLYAVGKLLAYLLTGKDPCEPPYDMLLYCERDRRLPPEIFKVIQRSLAVESLGRYASAEEFIRELKEAFKRAQKKKWKFFAKKQKIVYEKCVWKSEYQRIF